MHGAGRFDRLVSEEVGERKLFSPAAIRALALSEKESRNRENLAPLFTLETDCMMCSFNFLWCFAF